MRPFRLVLVLSLFIAVSSPRAAVFLKPSLGTYYLTGTTFYDITFGDYDTSLDPTNGYISAESKLEFDLRAAMVHLGIDAVNEDGVVAFTAGYDFSVAEPKGQLRDRDWAYNTYLNDTMGWDPLGGDTLSDLKSPARILSAGLRFRVLKHPITRLSATLDYKHMKFGTMEAYNVVGLYNGWMTDGVDYPVNMVYPTPVLTYEVSYGNYLAGLLAEFELGQGWNLDAQGRFGLVSYTDKDDHILRSKISEGSGSGTGWETRLNLGWRSKSGLGLSAWGSYQGIACTGKQEQSFYYGSLRFPIGKIDQKVEATVLCAGLEVSYRFGKAMVLDKELEKGGDDEIAGSVAERLKRDGGATSTNATPPPAETPTSKVRVIEIK